MPLKLHLIIICCIIAVVLAGYEVMSHAHGKTALTTPHGTIQIVRASWGLNCNAMTLTQNADTAQPVGQYPGMNSRQVVKEDNIHKLINGLCGGKESCRIQDSPDALGTDPAPDCNQKQVQVEYRCYTYDRLWKIVISPGETGSIDCSNVLP